MSLLVHLRRFQPRPRSAERSAAPGPAEFGIRPDKGVVALAWLMAATAGLMALAVAWALLFVAVRSLPVLAGVQLCIAIMGRIFR